MASIARTKGLFLLALFTMAALLLTLALTNASPGATVFAAPGSGCEGDVKVDGDPGTVDAGAGNTIEWLCIKAGRGIFIFDADGTDGCYTISGIGTQMVTVDGGGTSRDCKTISHVAFNTGTGEPPDPTKEPPDPTKEPPDPK